MRALSEHVPSLPVNISIQPAVYRIETDPVFLFFFCLIYLPSCPILFSILFSFVFLSNIFLFLSLFTASLFLSLLHASQPRADPNLSLFPHLLPRVRSVKTEIHQKSGGIATDRTAACTCVYLCVLWIRRWSGGILLTDRFQTLLRLMGKHDRVPSIFCFASDTTHTNTCCALCRKLMV